MTVRRESRFGVGAVLPMVLVAGLAVAALTSYTAGEARADHHHIELVSIEADGGKTAESCAGMTAADGSTCLDPAATSEVASTAVDEHESPKVMNKRSCSRASK